ncbi:prepilin peptidase [Microbacterium sp. G2-8]|uniref:prepilin peptidase n=1 Tax=Microbacterium sp. G2-8 TaxID=2842454 RepID=UPI001C8ABDA0|nr:prepilin peptidase [Microbacterium sp. G2-8]
MPLVDVLTAAVHVGFFGVAAWLAHIDIREHRLPNAIVGPLTAALALSVVLVSAVDGSADAPLRSLAGGLILGAVYLLLRAASGGGLGGGDVKLAVPIGMLLAWDGWLAFALGAGLAFVVGSAWAIGMIVSGAGTLRTHIAFGPCMILGACLGIALV